ncbi:MAG: DUF5666 domain-containing protein [Sedimentisphaerales bacterium]|nr:DUF5666 domain-containing protein [Sedimentisphaerales bacterium]
MMMKKVWITALCFVLASSILVKGESDNADGVIESIDDVALQITVEGQTVQVTLNTEITIMAFGDIQQEGLSFSDLALGMTVKVRGKMNDDDVLKADKIKIMYDGEIPE